MKFKNTLKYRFLRDMLTGARAEGYSSAILGSPDARPFMKLFFSLQRTSNKMWSS